MNQEKQVPSDQIFIIKSNNIKNIYLNYIIKETFINLKKIFVSLKNEKVGSRYNFVLFKDNLKKIIKKLIRGMKRPEH